MTTFEVRLGIAEKEEEEEKEADSSDDEEEIYTWRSTKRRRKTTTRMSSRIAAAAAGSEAIAPAMFKSTVEITQTLLACEDKERQTTPRSPGSRRTEAAYRRSQDGDQQS